MGEYKAVAGDRCSFTQCMAAWAGDKENEEVKFKYDHTYTQTGLTACHINYKPVLPFIIERRIIQSYELKLGIFMDVRNTVLFHLVV